MQAKKKKKAKKSSRRSQPAEGSRNKKPATRDKILAAALKVFAEHPYSTASIRMIGKAAGIDHPLISYYFPTKAELFEAVVEEMAETYYQANTSWLEGVGELSASQGLSLYIDRLIDFTSKHPEALRMIALNLVQPEKGESIPGYRQLQGLVASNIKTFRQVAALQGSADEIRMFIESFNTMVINYLGAANHKASILGMKPRSPAYRKWVKETLMYLFLPRLKQLISGEGQGALPKEDKR